jgi:hypothetical protein
VVGQPIQKRADQRTPKRRLRNIGREKIGRETRLEADFWEMGWRAGQRIE